jgi:hypothetical protein
VRRPGDRWRALRDVGLQPARPARVGAGFFDASHHVQSDAAWVSSQMTFSRHRQAVAASD